MTAIRTWVTPPELDPLPGVFQPDAARAWLIRQLEERVATARAEGDPASLVLGEEAGTAPGTVALLVARGVTRVSIVALSWQRPLVDVLTAELDVAKIGWTQEIVTAPEIPDAAALATTNDTLPLFEAERHPELLAALTADPSFGSIRLVRRRETLGWTEREHAALFALFARHCPQHLPHLISIAQQASHCIEPALEMWSGHGIADRNRDLVVNLVP